MGRDGVVRDRIEAGENEIQAIIAHETQNYCCGGTHKMQETVMRGVWDNREARPNAGGEREREREKCSPVGQ